MVLRTVLATGETNASSISNRRFRASGGKSSAGMRTQYQHSLAVAEENPSPQDVPVTIPTLDLADGHSKIVHMVVSRPTRGLTYAGGASVKRD